MVRYYSIFFIFFSIKVFAYDISEFKIEGIGLGDSLLNHFNVSEIQKAKVNYPYKDDKYFEVEFKIKSFENYPNIQVSLKKGDTSFEVYKISGFEFYDKNTKLCMDRVDKVSSEFSSIFKNIEAKVALENHKADPSGKSKAKVAQFGFDNGDVILVECYDWSEEMTSNLNYTDNFGLTILSSDIVFWLEYYAY